MTGPFGAQTCTVQVAFWPAWKLSWDAWTLTHRSAGVASTRAAVVADVVAEVVALGESVGEGEAEPVGDGVEEGVGLGVLLGFLARGGGPEEKGDAQKSDEDQQILDDYLDRELKRRGIDDAAATPSPPKDEQ